MIDANASAPFLVRGQLSSGCDGLELQSGHNWEFKEGCEDNCGEMVWVRDVSNAVCCTLWCEFWIEAATGVSSLRCSILLLVWRVLWRTVSTLSARCDVDEWGRVSVNLPGRVSRPTFTSVCFMSSSIPVHILSMTSSDVAGIALRIWLIMVARLGSSTSSTSSSQSECGLGELFIGCAVDSVASMNKLGSVLNNNNNQRTL